MKRIHSRFFIVTIAAIISVHAVQLMAQPAFCCTDPSGYFRSDCFERCITGCMGTGGQRKAAGEAADCVSTGTTACLDLPVSPDSICNSGRILNFFPQTVLPASVTCTTIPDSTTDLKNRTVSNAPRQEFSETSRVLKSTILLI